MFLKPSIEFEGQAEEALNFYKEVFNGEIDHLFRYADAPHPQSESLSEQQKQLIMNARIDFGMNKISVSDSLSNQKASAGNNIKLDLVLAIEEDVKPIFEALAKGGNITFPLIKTFFSPNFGELTDKFGIHWSFMQMPE